MRFNNRIKSKEFGFGKIDDRQRRLMNADGSYNFKRLGLAWHERFNFYQFLITVPLWRFGIIVLAFYTFINLIFTALYYVVGVWHLGGMIFKDDFERFLEVYFFSAQTLTTVGYGRINPIGIGAGFVATLEALVGLLIFAIFTGLLYARFSKPRDSILYSSSLLFAPYKEGIALMFRTANRFNSNLLNMNVQVSLSISLPDEQGNITRQFFNLALERDAIVFFPSSWTIVHPINEESPFLGLTKEDIKGAHPEIFVLMRGFDDAFDETIHARRSYAAEEIVWGARFSKITDLDSNAFPTVDLSRINEYEPFDLSDRVGKAINEG